MIGGVALELADVHYAFELEVLGHQRLCGLREDGLGQDLKQGGGVVRELVELARLRGELGSDVLPVTLGGEGLVHLGDGLVDGYGVFATG